MLKKVPDKTARKVVGGLAKTMGGAANAMATRTAPDVIQKARAMTKA
jgi:hypothetical protein